ncbi:hypothetical protein [Streptomyces sp. NRRL S-37]|uniref:hypothetical protein n=1 Tax=Streptomyces sp. NRRL S-37 TaxID=1463903 RepID=UPI0004C97A80|nr:hypothetical protein [Streptomyces sp. NRRL S-37]
MPAPVVASGVVGRQAVAAPVPRPAEGLPRSGKGPLGHWGFAAIGPCRRGRARRSLRIKGAAPSYGHR